MIDATSNNITASSQSILKNQNEKQVTNSNSAATNTIFDQDANNGNYTEDCKKIYNLHGFFQTCDSCNYRGLIRNKAANLHEEFNSRHFLSSEVKTSTVTGDINGKEISFTAEDSNGFFGGGSNTFTGEYNGIPFELKIDHGASGFLGLAGDQAKSIKGTIGGEEIDIDLSKSEVPNNSDANDIITTILMQMGYEAKTEDGKFKGTMMTDWASLQTPDAYGGYRIYTNQV